MSRVLTWPVWHARLEQIVLDAIGMHPDELPDYTATADLYADGLSPEEAWEEMKQDQGIDSWA